MWSVRTCALPPKALCKTCALQVIAGVGAGCDPVGAERAPPAQTKGSPLCLFLSRTLVMSGGRWVITSRASRVVAVGGGLRARYLVDSPE